MRQPRPYAEGGAAAQGEGCARCAGFSERRECNGKSAARKKTEPRLDSPDRMQNNAGRAKRAREPLGRDWRRSAPPSRCGKRGGRGDARGFGGERGEPRTDKRKGNRKQATTERAERRRADSAAKKRGEIFSICGAICSAREACHYERGWHRYPVGVGGAASHKRAASSPRR